MNKAFTLAEVLITLAIIGVVAALTIPSVVANTQQQEFKTGLKKAVSVLNSAITMNMAIDGETPYENTDLYKYFQRHMSVMKESASSQATPDGHVNLSFYTTDGMRFEFPNSGYLTGHRLYENPDISFQGARAGFVWDFDSGIISRYDSCKNVSDCSRCGSYGLKSNADNTTKPPCLITVDVNGDRKPFPKNASCFHNSCASTNVRKFSDPSGRKLTDSFAIMITDKQAIPYGMAAQKAMYEAQK